MKVKRICLLCGKEFFIDSYRIKKGRGIYCSRSCFYKAQVTRIKRVCKQCGKEFEVKSYLIKKGGGIFCSRKCQGIWQSKNQKGKNSPLWKGGKTINRICQQCGRKFKKYPSQIKSEAAKYCSYSCARKAQKMPNRHTKPERIFEQICKKNNLPFKYTGDGSFWIHNINPDFIDVNGKKIAVEIFGDYWHSPLLNPKLREDRTLPYRKKILKKYGWELVVFWESDLKRKDAEQFILLQLCKY